LARRLLEPFFAAMPPEALEFDGGRANAFVQIANYIDANLEKDISMPALAAFLKMRRADFSAEFRRVFGMPPKQYVIMRRLGRARSLLLKDRGMSVKEVAARVGYDNEFFFYRLFKKHLKSTPAEFRRSCS
jgi:AraC-like DNA-binding protein